MADEEKKGSGTYYAWSKFRKEVNEYGQVTEWINAGDTISQSDIGASDEDWQELIDVGAVREEEYPDIPDSMSPAEYQAKQESAEAAQAEAEAFLREARGESEEADQQQEDSSASPKQPGTAQQSQPTQEPPKPS